MTAPRPRCALGSEGGQNLRDLGGYPTLDGRTVRRGLIFRSGTMHGLTAQDHVMLRGLGIRTVCDFRNAHERGTAPVTWPHDAIPRVLFDDLGHDISLAPADAGTVPTLEEARATMARLYGDILDDLAGQYRGLFAELLAGHTPLIFNCTAGKDRTGIAAALLLLALGVSRAVAVEDYLLTNRYFDAARAMRSTSAASSWNDVPIEVLAVYQRADPAYLQTVFDRMDAHPGGEDRYLADTLGLDEPARSSLQAMYTR